jgi:hypothetical protein
LFLRSLSQRTPSGGFVPNDIVYSDDEEEDKVEVEDPEKADDSKMQDISIGIAEGKPSVRKDLLEVKVRPRRTVETHFDASDNIASTSTENLEDRMANAKGFCDGFAVASIATSHPETMARPILKRLLLFQI